MSVLKSKRTLSKAEYVNNAHAIFKYVLNFLVKLSAKYSRLLAAKTIELASDIADNCEKANSIYPSSEERIKLREKHLLEARAALMALDVKMAMVYEVMRMNPQANFITQYGKDVAPDIAMRRLDSMAVTLGELIDKENGYLTNLLKSDKSRLKA